MAYDGTLKFNTNMDVSGFQKGANSLTSIVKGLGVFKLLELGIKAIGDSLQVAFGRADVVEQFSRTMTVMTGSAHDAEMALDGVTAVVDGTAYSLNVAAKAVQAFSLSGMSVERSTETVKNLADAVSFYGDGTDATLSQVSLAFGKMASAGRVNLTDLNSIIYTGIPIMELWAAQTGQSVEDFRDAISNGEVSVQEFASVLNTALTEGAGKFPSVTGAAQKAGQSWAGTFDNMGIAVGRGTLSIINAVDTASAEIGGPGIRGALLNVAQTFEKFLKGVAKLIPPIVKNIDLIGLALGSVAAIMTGLRVGAFLKPIIAGFQTARLQVLLFAAANTISTASTAKDIAALTLKETVMGVLSGKIALATAAQHGWNLALLANPVGIVIVAVVAFAAALTALSFALSRTTDEEKRMQAQTDEVIESNKEALASIEENNAAREKETAATIASANAADNLVNKIDGMTESERNSADGKARLAAYVEQLNQLYPDLNVELNAEGTALKGGNLQLKQRVANLKQVAKAQAYQKQLAAETEELVELETELYRIEKEMATLREQGRDKENTFIVGKGSVEGTTKAYKELEAQQKATQAALAGTQNRVDTSSEAWSKFRNEVEMTTTSSGESIEELAARYGVSVAEIEAALKRDNQNLDEWQAKQEEALAAAEEAIRENFDAIVNGFAELPEKSEQSADEMIAILNKNAERYAKWTENMAALSGKLSEEAIEELRKLGPGANSAIEEMLNNTDKLKAFDDAVKAAMKAAGDSANSEEVKNQFGQAGEAASSAMAGALAGAGAQAAAVNAGKSVMNDAYTAVKEAATSLDFTAIGKQVTQQIISGIQSVELLSALSGVALAFTSLHTQINLILDLTYAGIHARLNKINNTIKTAFSGIGNAMSAPVRRAGTAVLALFRSLAAGVSSSVTLMTRGIVTTFTAGMLQFTATAKQGATQVPALFRTMMQSVNSQISSGTRTWKTTITNAMNGVVSAIRSAVDKARQGGYSVGIAAGEGVILGLTAMRNAINAKAAQIANGVRQAMAEALKVKSPSRVMVDLFTDVMRGALNGLTAGEDPLFNKADEIAAGLVTRLNSINGDIDTTLLDKFSSALTMQQAGLVAENRAVALARETGRVPSDARTIVLSQEVYTHDSLSPYELSQQQEALKSRLEWQL